jgi:hypothetical protein
LYTDARPHDLVKLSNEGAIVQPSKPRIAFSNNQAPSTQADISCTYELDACMHMLKISGFSRVSGALRYRRPTEEKAE